jgi:hypothetical protein
MLKYSIVDAIEKKCKTTGYTPWRIGLTHDIDDRKAYWQNHENDKLILWEDWKANSLSDAQDIESHFINKGMKGGTGGDLSAYKDVFIYVF